MRVLVIDNYDSFTYNLVQALGACGAAVVVRRSRALSVDEALQQASRVDRVVVSPGPGGPQDAGVSLGLIARLPPELPLLGVCLGHQCLAQSFGAQVERGEPVHGKTCLVEHDGQGVFAGLPSPTTVARYHSLIVARPTVPPELQISAQAPNGVVMALRHAHLPLEGVQFHPESFLTPQGPALLANFLERPWTGAPR